MNEAADSPARLVKNAAYITAGLIATNLTSLLKFAVIARTLAATELGVWSWLLTFGLLTTRVGGFGIAGAVVHFQEVAKSQLRTLRLVQVGLMTAFIFLVLLVLWAGDWLSSTTYALFAVLGAGYIFKAPGEFEQAIKTKAHRHGHNSSIDIINVFAGDATCILLLLAGYGLWSVVLGQVVSMLLFTTLHLLWRERRHELPLAQYASLESVRPMLKYGLVQMTEGLLNLASHRVDRLLISVWFGIAQLGLYELAIQLVLRPYQLFGVVLAKLYFPIYAQLQGQVAAVNAAYMRNQRLVVLLLLPCYALLAVLAEPVVEVFLGSTDPLLVRMLQWLCFYGFCSGFINPVGAYLFGLGYATESVKLQVRFTAWLGLTLVLGYLLGDLIWVVATFAMLGGLGKVCYDMWLRARLTDMAVAPQLLALGRASCVAFVVAAVAWIIVWQAEELLATPIVLTLALLLSGAVYLLLLYWLERSVLQRTLEAAKLWRRAEAQLK